MEIDTTTRIGADGLRYPIDDPDIPTDPAPYRTRDVEVVGEIDDGQVPVWDASEGHYVGGDAAGGGPISPLTADLVDITAYATPALAFDAAVSGDTLYTPPGNHTCPDLLTVPDGVGYFGYGQLRFTTAGAGLRFADPEGVYWGINVNGMNVCELPLKIGSGAELSGGGGVSGAKCAFYNTRVTQTGGPTAMEIQNLQNSVFYNTRFLNCEEATVAGLLIDNGAKNIGFFGIWGSDVGGPYVWITTTDPDGDQQTSKIRFRFGLFEVGDGFMLGDCEHVTLDELQIHARQGVGSDGVLCVADGDRSGSGPKMPSSITVVETGFVGFDNGLHIAGNMLNPLDTGGCSFSACDVNYRVEHANSSIQEIYPQKAEGGGDRFASAIGVVEQTAIRRSVAPTSVPITTTPLTWTDMPVALTELGGVDDFRQWADLASYRFARLSVQVKSGAPSGAKLRLMYRTTDGAFGAADTLGVTDIEVAVNSPGTVKSGWVALDSDAQVADVLLIVGGIGGDGADDPIFGSIVAEFA